MKPRSVCLIAAGINRQRLRLQPWRYLYEVARGLAARGHPVLLVSDGCPGELPGQGLQLVRLASIRNPPGWPNPGLHRLIRHHAPDVIVQHAGLTSCLSQNFISSLSSASIGVFTSPIYTWKDLIRLGPGRLVRRFPLTGAHLVGSCLPPGFVRARFARSGFDVLVVQTHTTRRQLLGLDLRNPPVAVIPPGVDEAWRQYSHRGGGSEPRDGQSAGDEVIFVYFGPAEQLRGFDTLQTAFTSACSQDSNLRLWILARGDGKNHASGPCGSKRLRQGLAGAFIQVEANPLSTEQLAARVASADVVVLPFELLSSDAPLSVIEAAALGLPLVTTPLACLPELAAPVPHFFAAPGDPGSLAQALLQAAGHVRAARNAPPGCAVPVRPARLWQEVGQEWSHLVQSL